jgi:hypothetical protein
LLNDAIPVEEIRPRFDWMTYREPEGHLDDSADALARLVGSNADAVYGGVSFKDDSLLERMKARGVARTWRIEPEADLGVMGAGAGVETIQDRLNPSRAAELLHRNGPCDVLIARHILEHAYDTGQLLQTFRELLKPDGFLVLEVPDCTRGMDTLDFTTVWEEHTLYFTPGTFQSFCASSGLEILQLEVIPYALENSIVGMVRFQDGFKRSQVSEEILGVEKRRALDFAGSFPNRRDGLRRWLADCRVEKGRVAVLGAGHLTCTFINLFELGEYVEFVADDDPNKQGLFMPGSRLPIRRSEALLDEDIRVCLLGVNPENEQAALQRQAPFVKAGGVLGSIFFASERGPRI